MRFNEAIKDLQFNRSKRYILTGEELFLKEQFEKMVLALHKDASVVFFYPGDEKEAKSALYSAGIFDDTVVVLKYLDQMKPDGFVELIKNYDCFLLITLSEQVNLKNSFLTSVISNCTNVQCSRMSEYNADYPTWILSRAKENEYLFVDGAEDLLFKRVGPDLMALSNELTKLFIYKRDTKSVYPEDVEKVVIASALTPTYEILDNILRKDTAKALRSMEKYFQVNDDVAGLLWFLGHYFEKMYRLLLMDDQGISAEGMADILNIPPSIVRSKYLPRSKSLGKDRLGKWLDGVCTLDVKIRSYGGQEKKLLSNFIISITS